MANEIQELIQEANKKIAQYRDTETIDVDIANSIVDLLGKATHILEESQKPTMHYYNPEETMSFDQSHTVQLKFQFENATAEVFTTMGGNIMGGSVLSSYTDLDTGITAPDDLPVNQKHCIFDALDQNKYKEVEGIIFYYPNGETVEFELEDAAAYLVSLEITDYRP